MFKYKNVIQPLIKDSFRDKSAAAKEYLNYFDAIVDDIELVK